MVKFYYILSPIPLILFFIIWFGLSQMDGWDAWAAASLIVWPIALSFILLLSGLVLIWLNSKRGLDLRGIIIATVVSSSVFFGFLVRLSLL